MSTAVKDETSKRTEYSQAEFLAAAKLYNRDKALIDAVSRCDCLDDAIVRVKESWKALEIQAENGAGFTPDRELGFGSDTAQIVAETLMGIRATVGAIRKAFRELGNK